MYNQDENEEDIDYELYGKLIETLDAALRLANEDEGIIVSFEATADNVPFVLCIGAGKGATRLKNIVKKVSIIDPRGKQEE